MVFTGRNLRLVQYALELADAEIHNQIAMCPDVIEFEDKIEALEEDQIYLKRLLDRVNMAICKENN